MPVTSARICTAWASVPEVSVTAASPFGSVDTVSGLNLAPPPVIWYSVNRMLTRWLKSTGRALASSTSNTRVAFSLSPP